MLKAYNTLSRKVEAVKPLKGKQLKIYTCGPTVYDYAHIGNLRTYTLQDMLRRYLKFKGFKVFQVMNLTDVDDKTIKGARKSGIPLKQYTEKYTKAFLEDIKELNIEKPEVLVPATKTIKEMISLIKKLLKKKLAYKGEDASIYYSVKKFKKYGKLSGIKVKNLKAGARVKQDEYSKEEAQDFALWKSYSEEDGNVFWNTELGKGRPGWHIECSAMSTKYLGETFDLHSGGIDLIFPHHENEIAQSEGASGKKFVKHWIHMEHLLVEGKKMAKSLGNFYTLRDLKEKGFSGRELRMLYLNSHYRQQENFTFKGLEQAREKLESFDEFVRKVNNAKGTGEEKLSAKYLKEFEKAMDSDLNSPKAFAVLNEFMKKTNYLIDKKRLGVKGKEKVLTALKKIDSVFAVFKFKFEDEVSEKDMELIKKREKLRKEMRFIEADEIRKKLLEKGIQLDDTASGTVWKKVKA